MLATLGVAATLGATLLIWRRCRLLLQRPVEDAGGSPASEPNQKKAIRNAEKDRRASCSFADRVASCTKEEYLLRRSFQHRQTVLASILALRENELFVVSFGVGTKFLKEAKSKDAVRDLHAEILARRGLLRFLHEDLLRCWKGETTVLVERCKDNWCKLRDDISLHLYTSSVPCGNASWKRWAKGGSQCPHVDSQASTLWPKQLHPLIHLHARREGQAAFLVKSDLKEDQSKPHGIGPVPAGTAPFLSECRHRSQGPLSCSDKMAQWSALGLGNLELSGGLRPLHLATCTVGRKFSWPHAARALCCRLQDFDRSHLEELPEGYGIQHLDLLGCSVKLDDGVYEDGAGADFSDHRCLVWTRGDEVAEILDGRSGLVADTGATSSISPRSLAELSRKWQQFLPSEVVATRQEAYREAKTLLRRYVDERCSASGGKRRRHVSNADRELLREASSLLVISADSPTRGLR